jgi:hypothetical protein
MRTSNKAMTRATSLGSLLLIITLAAGCGGSPPPAPASRPAQEAPEATSRDFDDYIVYFNAIPTDKLTPEVAQANGIVRSKNRALMNISVVRKGEGTPGQPVPATVTALVANDTGQIKDANVREIREGDAVYYIADFAVSNAETLNFTVDATPTGETSRLSVRFSRTFFNE